VTDADIGPDCFMNIGICIDFARFKANKSYRLPKVTSPFMTDSTPLARARYRRAVGRMELLCVGAKRIRELYSLSFPEESYEDFRVASGCVDLYSID
jgi:hypothetical protein